MNGIKKKIGVDFEAVNVASNSDDDDGEDGKEKTEDMGYQQTLMYGRYSRSLAEDIKEEAAQAKRQKLVEKLRQKEMKKRHYETELKSQSSFVRKISVVSRWIWRRTFAKLGEDWVFLAVLGIIMAVVSFIMDTAIAMCGHARHWLVEDLVENIYLQFLAWVSLPVLLILFR